MVGIYDILSYVDVGEVAESYFPSRLSEFAAIFPSENDDRVNAIMQYV